MWRTALKNEIEAVYPVLCVCVSPGPSVGLRSSTATENRVSNLNNVNKN